MKDKIQKVLIKLGNIVAVLLMFMPIVIIVFDHSNDKYWYILLFFSICYDFYIYDRIQKDSYIEDITNQIDNIENKNGIIKTSEDKAKSYEILCKNIASKFK